MVIIVLLSCLHPHFHGGPENGEALYALAIAVLVATFVQLGWRSGRSGGSTSGCVHIAWRDPHRSVFMPTLPVAIGLGI